MNKSARIDFYAKHTSLSRAAARRYMAQPVSAWSTRSDRKIGGLFRTLEVLAEEEDLTWVKWRRHARSILQDIHDFIAGVLETVAEFVKRVGATVTRVLKELRRILEAAGPLLELLTVVLGTSAVRALRA